MAALNTLKRREDFLRLRSGRKWVTPAFVLQGMRRPPERNGAGKARFGFTVSSKAVSTQEASERKRGSAVKRNRARRRLKEAVRHLAATHARPDFDYVVIGRAQALTRSFDDLLVDMKRAFSKVNNSGQPGRRPKRRIKTEESKQKG